MTVYNDEVYVCDNHSHLIQVFDLDLNLERENCLDPNVFILLTITCM